MLSSEGKIVPQREISVCCVAEIEGQRKIGSTFSNAFKATTRLIVISNF
jgi:hypothetical protein